MIYEPFGKDECPRISWTGVRLCRSSSRCNLSRLLPTLCSCQCFCELKDILLEGLQSFLVDDPRVWGATAFEARWMLGCTMTGFARVRVSDSAGRTRPLND